MSFDKTFDLTAGGYFFNIIITHGSFGYCGADVHNSQKFPVGMKTQYPYPGYCGIDRRSELTEVLGTGMNVIQKLTEVPGTGMNASQNLQKFFVG